MNLRNTTALVTGGSSGIGLSIAKALIDAGSKVAITGRNQDRLAEAAKAIGAHPIKADVSSDEDVTRTYREFFDKFGHLDILVNNAAFGERRSLVDMDREKFNAILQTNVIGMMLMSREAAKHFVERKAGNIINIGSTARRARRGGRHVLLREQVCGARYDRMLARRAAATQRPGVPRQSERGSDQLCGHRRLPAGRQEPDQAAVGGYRAHRESDARDERSRLYDGVDGLRDQSERLRSLDSGLSNHEAHMRDVFAIARRARAHGNRPFGAMLVAGNGAVLAVAENSQITEEQILAHAEMNLLHRAVQDFAPDVLATSTLYTSAEPCAMCAGAIFWSGIRRLVFGLSADRLHQLSGFSPEALVLSARDILASAGRQVEIVGPVFESEAEAILREGEF